MLDLFLTFLKIGAVSFGGGYGMIPMLTEEVISHGWLTESEILNFIAVSESTPGPIAINMATFVGASQGGPLGAFLATLGV
ncbi:MAG: chromate transporter, partial [Clostridia bacterium]|nr:chromate transporter [Clostridia bacterium]